MRPVEKSLRMDNGGEPLEIKPYGGAKAALVQELGAYCSFCERAYPMPALAVEHIYPKNFKDAAGIRRYADLEFRWDNFLLGCVTCNSIKGDQDTAALDPFLPHTDTLLCYIRMLPEGVLQLADGLPATEQRRAAAFFTLTGIDRRPGNPMHSTKDDRWDARMRAYTLAVRYLHKLEADPPESDLETVCSLAAAYGFFSVWYTVFAAHPAIRQALIAAFPGTCQAAFGPASPFDPIPRTAA